MRGRFMGACALLVLILTSPARADSDGYYCSGDGYLAYEVRFQANAQGHELRIISFGDATGIQSPVLVPLEDFQVFGMRCDPDAVLLESADVRYTVDISDPAAPRVNAAPISPEETRLPNAQNLGDWSPEGIDTLQRCHGGGSYELVVLKAEHGAGGGIVRYTHAQLLHRDAHWRILQVRHLYDGVFLETID